MNYFNILILIFSLITVNIKAEISPIPIWHKYLEEFFKDYYPFPSSNYSFENDIQSLKLNFNKFEKENQCKKKDFSYYLFLIQTKLNYSKNSDEVDYRSYLGICLPNYNATELDLLLMTYFYLWEEKNLTSSFIIDYSNPLNENNEIRFRAYFFGFILIFYLFFNIYVSFFPSTEIFKSNIELEKDKKKTEEDIEFLLKDEPQSQTSLDSIDLIQSLNFNDLYVKGDKNKNYNLSAKDKIEEFLSIYDAKTMNRIYNCFSLKLNLQSLFIIKKIKKEDLKEEEREIKIINSIISFSFILVSYYTILPIIERVPIKNPKNFYEKTESIITQFIFNGDLIYDIIFTLNGFIVSYIYIRKQNEMNIKYVLLQIFYRIFPIYFLLISVYLIYSQIFLLFKHTPLTKYFYNEEIYSCDCQMVNIFLLIANFTYGLYERYFPFCIYHIWAILVNEQYFIAGIFLIYSYSRFKALFVVIFTLFAFNFFILHIFSIGSNSPMLTYIDLINRNLRLVYGKFGLKIFTRAGPFLIGFITGILYSNSKKLSKKTYASIIYKMQNELIYLNLIVFSIIFLFIFHINYLELHEYISFSKSYWIVWLYNLGKHDFFSISFIGITISLLSNKNTVIQKITNFIFLNNLFTFLQKISLCYYILLSVVARGFFYKFTEPISVSNFSLIYYFIILSIINLFISIVFVLFFYSPFAGINEIIKGIYLNKK